MKRVDRRNRKKHESTAEGKPQRGFSEQIAQPLFQTYRQQLSNMNTSSEASKVPLSQQRHAQGYKNKPVHNQSST